MGILDLFKPKNVIIEQPVQYVGEMPDSEFIFGIEDVFSITGRGIVVTGRVQKGTIMVGENVKIYSNGQILESSVTGIEMFRKTLDVANEGDNCGLLLNGITRDQIHRGDFVIK